MAETARKGPKFQWDYDIPQTPFWTSIPYPAARNILQCFTSSELSTLDFDSTLSQDQKLNYLRTIIQDKVSAQEAAAQAQGGRNLHATDYKTWTLLKLALSSVEHTAGNFSEDEKIVYEMYENGPLDPETGKPTKNLSALHRIAGIKESKGEYAEAEEIERETILPWFEGHESLGRDAPQTISCVRWIAKAVWKQGRYEEAEGWLKEAWARIDLMREGKFAKYVDDEVKQVDELIAELKDWREEHEKKGMKV